MRPLILLAVFALQGCVTAPSPAPSPVPSLEMLQSFSLQGRVSVQYDEQSLSGQMSWTANAQGDEVLLSSPLGQGLASIRKNELGVVLMRPGEPVLAAENVEALTQKALGFRLPLSGLRFWIQARPDPSSKSEMRVNSAGSVEQIAQDGWKIDYLQYSENRPRKIHVIREGLEIRLVIDAWQTY